MSHLIASKTKSKAVLYSCQRKTHQ